MALKAHAPLPQMSLAVVGVRHANADKKKSNRRFEIALCKPGDAIELRPEPKNKADERAVAVFGPHGKQLGYLTAERCGRIGAMIREGRELRAVFQAETEFGAWIRVAFDGEEPVPQATSASMTDPSWRPRPSRSQPDGADPDYGFAPDEFPPDEQHPDYWGAE